MYGNLKIKQTACLCDYRGNYGITSNTGSKAEGAIFLRRHILLCPLYINRSTMFLWNWYTFKKDNSVKIVLLPSEKRSTLKGKNLLPLGANSFLLGLTPF